MRYLIPILIFTLPAYGGVCDYMGDTASDGSSCGKRAAAYRCGGRLGGGPHCSGLGSYMSEVEFQKRFYKRYIGLDFSGMEINTVEELEIAAAKIEKRLKQKKLKEAKAHAEWSRRHHYASERFNHAQATQWKIKLIMDKQFHNWSIGKHILVIMGMFVGLLFAVRLGFIVVLCNIEYVKQQRVLCVDVQ